MDDEFYTLEESNHSNDNGFGFFAFTCVFIGAMFLANYVA